MCNTERKSKRRGAGDVVNTERLLTHSCVSEQLFAGQLGPVGGTAPPRGRVDCAVGWNSCAVGGAVEAVWALNQL